MEMFLVKGEIFSITYMSEKGSYFEDIRIVMADSLSEAREKYCNFWKIKSREYCVYYNVDVCDVTETIR